MATQRTRRGKIVDIPEEWQGVTTHPQTIRKRKSKSGQDKNFKRKVVR